MVAAILKGKYYPRQAAEAISSEEESHDLHLMFEDGKMSSGRRKEENDGGVAM